MVRDAADRVVLATFATETLWKDDMVAGRAVSLEVERRRQRDPYYLTSPTLALGSLLTEGEHLWLDRSHDWRAALALVLEDLQADQTANVVALRDLPADDPEMDGFLLEQGFAKLAMPDSLVLDLGDPATYLQELSRGGRRLLKQQVLPREGNFTIEPTRDPALVPTLHQLYRNVKARNVDLNVFALPASLFANMLARPEWEVLVLRYQGRPVAFLSAFIGADHYVPLVAGLDYDYVVEHGAYRQVLWTAIKQARLHGCKRVYFGMGATFEKQRFGAKVRPQALYFQARDHFNLDQLAQIMSGIGAR
jgi:hypothetical protein